MLKVLKAQLKELKVFKDSKVLRALKEETQVLKELKVLEEM